MGRLKYFCFVFLFFYKACETFAQVGCYRSANNTVYISYDSFFGWWSSASPSNCPAGSSTSTDFARVLTNTTTPATPCDVLGILGSNNGFLVNYQIIKCSLDDYIWFLFLLLGGLGFHYMRKRYFQKLEVF